MKKSDAEKMAKNTIDESIQKGIFADYLRENRSQVEQIIMNQLDRLAEREINMRLNRKQGAVEALDKFGLSHEFIPADEYKYTEPGEQAAEKYFMQDEHIWGAIAALRAAGLKADVILGYIAERYKISEQYARSYFDDEDDFLERIGGVL